MRTETHKWQHIAVLCAILVLGFFARTYNLNFPSIGYHNMKENEYLSMAQEMRRTGDYVTRRVYFYNAFKEDPAMKLYPQPPLVTYQILLSWRLFGENLWGPRLLNALFGVFSILVIYLAALVLFRNVVLSLFSAFLLAIMPLAVFFSRNLQPESPGFFFMLLGNLFYLKFASTLKKRNLILGGLAISIAWIYKFNFILGALPFAFCFPYRKIFAQKKELVKYSLAFLVPYSVILAAYAWQRSVGQWEFPAFVLARIKPFEIFTAAYWAKHGSMIWRYTYSENYTPIYTALTLGGMLFAFSDRKTLLDRYIIGWTVSIIPYSMVWSDLINQHNYYQMPFLPLVCISSIYAISRISQAIERNFKKDVFIFLAIIIAALSIQPARIASLRAYGTVFLGLDVASESLRDFTRPEERIFLKTHPQGYGIARYARRYVGWTDDLEDFKNKERDFDIRYLCFYPAEFAFQVRAGNPELFEHIRDNYRVKEAGLTGDPDRLRYVILERGEGSNPDDFLKSFVGTRQLRTIYKLFGRYIFFYTIRPPLDESPADDTPADAVPVQEAPPPPSEGAKEGDSA